MEKGKHRVTTKEQLEKLIEIMGMHPEIGRGKPQFGCSKNKVKELWEQFAVELNSLGPPARNAHEWGRVWIHYKAKLKRKLANNRRNFLATGGGPSQEISLNPLEKSVAELIQINEQVAPTGYPFGLENIPPAMDVSEATVIPDVPHIEIDVDRPTSSASQKSKNCRKKKNVEDERLELLKTQAQTQKDLLKKIDNLEKTVYKSYEVKKKLLELKKRKFVIYERQAREAHELHELKIEVQKLKIEKMRGQFMYNN